MPSPSITPREGRLMAAVKATISFSPSRPNPSYIAARAASVA